MYLSSPKSSGKGPIMIESMAPTSDPDLASAATALFRAEMALHDAEQSGVEVWIHAASQRLIDADARYAAVRGTRDRLVVSLEADLAGVA